MTMISWVRIKCAVCGYEDEYGHLDSTNSFGPCDLDKIGFTYGNKTENLPIIIYALTVNGKKTEVNKTENGYYANDVVISENARNSFMLAWEWQFDGESDEKDTETGRKGEKYECGIFITAEEI